MEQKDIASFQIDKSIVEGVVAKAIKTAVVAQLSQGQDILIDKIASYIINEKVNANGVRIEGYRSDEENKFTVIQVLFSQQLKEFAKQAVAEWIEKNKPEIKKKIQEAMKKSNMEEAFIGAMLQNITSSYSTTVNVNFRKNDR